jgi:putative transposase
VDCANAAEALHRHLMAAPDYRTEMILRFTIWEQITGVTGQPTTT